MLLRIFATIVIKHIDLNYHFLACYQGNTHFVEWFRNIASSSILWKILGNLFDAEGGTTKYFKQQNTKSEHLEICYSDWDCPRLKDAQVKDAGKSQVGQFGLSIPGVTTRTGVHECSRVSRHHSREND